MCDVYICIQTCMYIIIPYISMCVVFEAAVYVCVPCCRFCQEVGGMLEVIVEDSSHYLLPLDTGSLPAQRVRV